MAIAKWIRGAPPVVTSEVVTPQQVQVQITPADGKQFGLENFGNICYANSVLQALYFCSPFRELLLQCPDPSLLLPQKSAPAATSATVPPTTSTVRRKPERKPTSEALPPNGTPHPPGPPIPSSPTTLFSALRSLFLHISKNPADKGTVAPRAFIEKLKDVNSEFRNTNQQDAHEFLNFLLNRIVEEITEDRKHQSKEDLSNSVGTLFSSTIVTPTMSSNSGTSPQDATLVHKLFEGVLTSETRCLTCETVSSRDESFLDLSIDIEQNSSVTACLRQFSASEMLCQKNKFFCDSCCDLQEAEKRMKIKQLPNVLALHLKRFKYQEDLQKYIKLAYRVAFPFQLRLFNTVDDAQDPDRLYELFAIVVHIGNGPHHGHYVTIIHTPATWLVFDDESVEPIKESEISKYFGDSNSGSAYVLYYQAVDLDLVALGLRPTTPAHVPEPSPAPKQHSSEPPGSPPAQTPSLPPGLSDEPDLSVVGDPPPPITPSQPSPLTAPFADRTQSPVSVKQPLTVNVSAPNDVYSTPSASSSSSPTVPSSSAGTKLFKSLRHSPSVKIRGPGSSNGTGLEKRKSLREKMSRPSTSTGLPPKHAPKHDEPPDLPSIFVPPSPVPVPVVDKNKEREKHREPERKASTWFKRKSGRADKRPETSNGTPSSVYPETDPGSPAAAWFRQSHVSVEPTQRRRPSVSSLHDTGVFRSLAALTPKNSHSPKPSADLSFTAQNGLSDRKSIHDSPSPASATSSFVSSSVHPDAVPNSTALPPIPASPQGPAIRQPVYIHSPTVFPTAPNSPMDHRRSQPQLKVKRTKEYDSPVSTKEPPRPSTAGASAERSTRISGPEEPLPPLPAFVRTHRRGPNNDQGSDTTGTTGSEGRPHSVHIAATASSDGDTVSGSLSNGLTVPLKRASRKLSLSSPILGFGKKDKKEKERAFAYEKVTERNAKEREKEARARAKEREKEEKARLKEEARKKAQEELARSPNAFPNFAVMPRI